MTDVTPLLVTKDHILIVYVRPGEREDVIQKAMGSVAGEGAKAVIAIQDSVRIESVEATPLMVLRVPAAMPDAQVERVESALSELRLPPGIEMVALRDGTTFESMSDEELFAKGLIRIRAIDEVMAG